MYIQNFSENIFVKNVTDSYIELGKKLFTKDTLKNLPNISKAQQNENWNNFSLDERFRVTTYQLMHEIIKKVELLEYCIVFLNSYPKRRLWEKTFSRSEYIVYHLESYYRNITGVLDRCLLLVNHLYRLGFKPSDVKFHLVVNNTNLKGQEVIKILDAINTGIQSIKGLRNLIEHRGRYSDKKLDDIEFYRGLIETMIKFPDKFRTKDKDMFKKYLKSQYDSYIKDKKQEIKNNNKTIIFITNKFFTSLINIHKDPLQIF